MRALAILIGAFGLSCSNVAEKPGPNTAAGASNGGNSAATTGGALTGTAASGGLLGQSGGGGALVVAGAAGMSASGAGTGGGGAPSNTDGGAGGAAGSAGSGGFAGMIEPPRASGVLCVFDYDLTLSTNNCIKEQYACRSNSCLTYNWYQQCMSSGARHAIEVCVERGAYIGIASHASVDGCWDDKVSVIISQQQFPALTGAVRYDNAKTDFSYPKIDLRSNWNCDDCAYHMNGAFSKPQLIAKVMTHYGMDPKSATDRAKVIFWDDLPDNVAKMKSDMPEVHTVHVHENVDGQPNSGGCGILESDVEAGWAAFPK